jgi:hypothetical protein
MVLETFTMASLTGDGYGRRFQLDVEDAVAIPWASARDKFLEIAINLGGDESGKDDDDLD